jgi:predicted nucleic acid-binding protein
MRRYLLDTGILVHCARESELYKQIEKIEKLGADDCSPMISVASFGEILSFANQHKWGANKKQIIQKLVNKIIVIDINSGDNSLIDAYATIDAFSKGKLAGHSLGRSAINMGKNDLWIAATAKVANAKLLTIDGDFDHLHGSFIEVIKYIQK